ncbi:hypothetical protein BH09BAC6_BH09BAC6_17890 [soil metagenome]|jgi:hypothetical protein
MASVIDPQLAKTLIKNYQEQNSSAGGPALKTAYGQFLNGFFIDRESLEAALKNPACTGLSLHFAKHPEHQDSKENVFTIVFAGAEPNPEWNEEAENTPKYLNNGDAFEYMTPCPPDCSTLCP